MHIEHCGDRAFLIQLGDRADPALSRRIGALRQRLVTERPAGFEDAVPGFVTLLVMFDPDVTTPQTLCDIALQLIPGEDERAVRRTWTLPVCYHVSVAPDLSSVAAAAGLSCDEVARLHASRCYTVYLTGFSPGFPYMGDVDPRLALPRRAHPRLRVPAGSVAIATAYTAIYPQETPGGWHLIGRTPVRLFDAAARPPALLQPGDSVRFDPVPLDEYETLCARAASGGYSPQCAESIA